MKSNRPILVFTGGGTAGHVFPGLAILEVLQEQTEAEVLWIGSTDGPERTYVTQAGLPFRGIPSGKLRRYFDWKNFTDLFSIAAGFFVCLGLFIARRPLWVFSKGGFVSVPPVWAAGVLGIPVYSHESDLDPGLATRLNRPFTRRQYLAYEASRRFFPPAFAPRLVVTGNPVRRALFEGDRPRGRARWGLGPNQLLVAVMGGSQGARQVNELVWAAVPLLAGRCVWVHQTGALDPADSARRPQTPDYHPAPFFDKTALADLLAAADLVVGRAGAGTLWDLAALGLPSLLIPLAAGSRGDQVRNAQLFAQAGAAEVLLDPSLEDFTRVLSALLADAPRRAALGAGAAGFEARQAASKVAFDLLAQSGLGGAAHV